MSVSKAHLSMRQSVIGSRQSAVGMGNAARLRLPKTYCRLPSLAFFVRRMIICAAIGMPTETST
jgi:hypothetical protein